jgi:UDP-N-acetylmuramoylalanine--D-glutamate ligase
MTLDDLKDKKIAILGFGLEGTATFEFLRKHGLGSTILDRADRKAIEEKIGSLDGVDLALGDDYLKNLTEFDYIFKTPGVPLFLPEIQAAIKKGVVLTSHLALFLDLCPAKIIGVTGTKGKGTTSTLIHDILKKQGLDVYLGGNIGLAAISFLDQLTPESWVVLELSSFQLQSLEKSPQIAVVLNVTQDHLDYHKTVEEYREAKKNIVRYQAENDFAVINADYESSREFANATKAKIYYFSKEKEVEGCFIKDGEVILKTAEETFKIVSVKDLLLRGQHNLENVTAACLASYLAGARQKALREAVLAFKGLEHRLELVRDLKGVKFYDDSFSTVPETAIAALKSFEEPIVLIAGGSYKGSDYTELGRVIRSSQVKTIILIGDMAGDIDKAIGRNFSGEKILHLTRMNQMVEKAFELAHSGDVVLLSPACASFGLFKNYKDRGDQFKTAVRNLERA